MINLALLIALTSPVPSLAAAPTNAPVTVRIKVKIPLDAAWTGLQIVILPANPEAPGVKVPGTVAALPAAEGAWTIEQEAKAENAAPPQAKEQAEAAAANIEAGSVFDGSSKMPSESGAVAPDKPRRSANRLRLGNRPPQELERLIAEKGGKHQAILRRHLVSGESQTAIARELKFTPSYISFIVKGFIDKIDILPLSASGDA